MVPSSTKQIPWQELKEQAEMLVSSGFLPNSVKTPAQAIAIALKGQSLGWDPMTSMNYINIIQGKPTISAEGMLSLIYKKFPTAIINFTRYDSKGCSVEVTRPGGTPQSFKFDEEDAKSAGLLGKGPWKSYARAMYRSRCISEMARSVFPDALMGCSYTPEELESVPSQAPAHQSLPAPSNQLYRVQPMTQRPSFDKNKTAHLKKIASMLDERKVDITHRAKIISEMHGKTSSDLDSVIQACVSDDFVSSLDEDFDIPFAPTQDKKEEVIDV